MCGLPHAILCFIFRTSVQYLVCVEKILEREHAKNDVAMLPQTLIDGSEEKLVYCWMLDGDESAGFPNTFSSPLLVKKRAKFAIRAS